jgi:ABC-2 type transport system permease protein
MNYLLDDQALISVRSRTIELRKLAADKIQTSSGSIKLLNTLAPMLVVIVMGIIQFVWRKKRWTQKAA